MALKHCAWVSATVLLLGCSSDQAGPDQADAVVDASPSLVCDAGLAGERLRPESGVWLGVNLDWSKDSPQDYGQRLGRHPAVFTSFSPIPIDAQHGEYVDAAVAMLKQSGSMLLLTLEPLQGLDSVTPEIAELTARRLAGYNAQGVMVLLRFAHEMNGDWYVWSQQPAKYIAAFRRMAEAVHRIAPGTAMLWAPNYGGGYPFSGGPHGARQGSADAIALDTNGDGQLTWWDDPYAPYYPGDDAVDWVGMSLYHWGAKYPWGSNDLPEPGKFADMLTGGYRGTAGDHGVLPDFYQEFGELRGKPVGLFETGAMFAPENGGADEFELKSLWWQQIYSDEVPRRFPKLKMINWFEWDKFETEINGRIDWGVTVTPRIRDAYRQALPSWARFAEDVRFCAETGKR